MRRMIDPNELGGGSNLYCHRITLTNTPNNMIVINYFNTSDVPFTRSSFITKVAVGHRLPCSGAITSSTSGTKIKYIPNRLYINTSYNLSCYAIDLDTNANTSVDLENYNFSDDVLPA